MIQVLLTNSSISNKKSLEVNGKKVIEKEKMPNFGRVSYSLKDIDIVPVSIIHTTDESIDYDLVVAGVRFSDLQKQWKKVHS